MYELNWISDYDEWQQVEKGIVCAENIGEAAKKVSEFYSGTCSEILDMELHALEDIQPAKDLKDWD